MTKDDVISAAFRVWGQELYKTTSLAKLAQALKVSKPALYRHFPDKETLLEVMESRFYDSYAAALRPVIKEALSYSNWKDGLLVFVRHIAVYFACHFDYFIYSMILIHGKEDHFFNSRDAMQKRGIFFEGMDELPIDRQYPSILFLTGITAIMETAQFHKRRHGIKEHIHSNVVFLTELEEPSGEEVRRFADAVVEQVRLGLGFDRAVIDALPYAQLENSERTPPAPPDPLLKAVAQAVAKEGPWNASMEKVAKQSGLSKSSLYSRFKNKADMLSRLFMSEFERIAQYAAGRSVLGKNREERLYLISLSIASYLRERPEILTALDWIRIQRLHLDLSVPLELNNFFADLDVDYSTGENRENISQWMFFLLGTVLVSHHNQKEPPEMGYPGLRKIFRFVTLGIEGL